ncbi:heavy metal translocating P-type ATPase metal-binding domain-containing protein, partial [Candidatus Woesearchaeota archaeon]|nr:heavy metal translocating P-type ATPase metal-binding domain-containing protein [Candidatus Woesearchaeota archaeon]
MEYKTCFHCGLDATSSEILYDDKSFCCNGCKTVYEIFSANDLTCYYDLQNAPGATPKEVAGKYNFLENNKIVDQLLEFNNDDIQIVSLYIPHIHCSSCIWILENLNKLHPSVSSSIVNFGKKTVRITYNSEQLSLKNLVELLSSIGYEPYISLEDYSVGKKRIDRSLIYKLGVAGFAFGNVMFLSFPEYFEVGEFWLEQYKHLFRWLMFGFSLPVVFYSAQDYFISAYKGLRSKILNIDV